MRSMRLAKREIKDPEKLREILSACRVLRIGTLDEEGIYLVPVNYGYEWEPQDSLKFYIHSAKEGRKADAFAKNSQVSFELDRELGVIRGSYSCTYSFAFQSIFGQGKIRKVTGEEEKRKGLGLLMKQMDPECCIHFSEEMLQAADVYCIETDWFTGKERKPVL